jgi:excisionase family DNA binding protein
MPELMNEQEVCQRLGMSIQTVRNLRYSGRLPFIRLGGPVRGPVRVRRADLETFLMTNSPATQAK